MGIQPEVINVHPSIVCNAYGFDYFLGNQENGVDSLSTQPRRMASRIFGAIFQAVESAL
jgi:hypothetical protein